MTQQLDLFGSNGPRRVVVVEGPDGAGKSTLCEQLSISLNWPVHHDGGPSTDAHHYQRRVEALAGQHRGLNDRSTLFSDAIYRTAFGKEPYSDANQRAGWITHVSLNQGTLMVYCDTDDETLMSNLITREQNKPHKSQELIDQVAANYSQIVGLYRERISVWAACGLPIIRYDFQRDDIKAVCSIIREYYWMRS